MKILYGLALLSVVLSAGLAVYFVKRKVFGGLGAALTVLVSVCVSAVCVRTKSDVAAACFALVLMVLAGMCLALELSVSDKTPPRRRKADDDDEDEYISTASTMTVREIVNAYTSSPQSAEKRLTNTPMNVTGRVTRIANGGNYSHVELDKVFMCICPQGSVKSLSVGTKVCITGTLRGKLLLDDCVMVKYPL